MYKLFRLLSSKIDRFFSSFGQKIYKPRPVLDYKIKKVEGLNKIWLYWEGKRPSYIDLCLDTVKRHCSANFEIILLTPKTFLKYIEPIPESWYKIKSINHKVDYIKAKLIYEQGGFWIDSDMIVTRDLSPLLNYLYRYDFIGMPGFFGGVVGSETLGTWVKAMEKIINNSTTHVFDWGELIEPLLQSKEYRNYFPLTKEMITPIWYKDKDMAKFFSKIEDVNRYINNNNFIVTLYNKLFPKWFKELSRQQILDGDWLISKMFKKALGEYERKSNLGKWNYKNIKQPIMYGDEITYKKGAEFLDGQGDIEDWGCGTGWMKEYIKDSHYIGIDGSESKFVDKVVDLVEYTSNVDCIFIRHILEHDDNWKRILSNAIKSFKKRMVLVIFTPFSKTTHVLMRHKGGEYSPDNEAGYPGGIPCISFNKEELISFFKHLKFTEEFIKTKSAYGRERIFYIEKNAENIE